jgi:hypothetical protein
LRGRCAKSLLQLQQRVDLQFHQQASKPRFSVSGIATLSTILVAISETGEGRTSPLQEPEGRSSVSGRGSCKGRRSRSAINGCKCCTVCRQARSPLQRRARLAMPSVREVATLSSSRVAAPAARALSVVSARFLHGQRVKSSFLSVHGSCAVDEPSPRSRDGQGSLCHPLLWRATPSAQ